VYNRSFGLGMREGRYCEGGTILEESRRRMRGVEERPFRAALREEMEESGRRMRGVEERPFRAASREEMEESRRRMRGVEERRFRAASREERNRASAPVRDRA